MVGAQVGNCTHVSVSVLWASILLCNVVHHVLIFLAICINHRGHVFTVRITFALHVPLFLTVSADDVWVVGAIGGCRPIVADLSVAVVLGQEPVVPGSNGGDLLDLLLIEVFPDD